MFFKNSSKRNLKRKNCGHYPFPPMGIHTSLLHLHCWFTHKSIYSIFCQKCFVVEILKHARTLYYSSYCNDISIANIKFFTAGQKNIPLSDEFGLDDNMRSRHAIFRCPYHPCGKLHILVSVHRDCLRFFSSMKFCGLIAPKTKNSSAYQEHCKKYFCPPHSAKPVAIKVIRTSPGFKLLSCTAPKMIRAWGEISSFICWAAS